MCPASRWFHRGAGEEVTAGTSGIKNSKSLLPAGRAQGELQGEVIFPRGFGILSGGSRSNSWEMGRKGAQMEAKEELGLAEAESV